MLSLEIRGSCSGRDALSPGGFNVVDVNITSFCLVIEFVDPDQYSTYWSQWNEDSSDRFTAQILMGL